MTSKSLFGERDWKVFLLPPFLSGDQWRVPHWVIVLRWRNKADLEKTFENAQEDQLVKLLKECILLPENGKGWIQFWCGPEGLFVFFNRMVKAPSGSLKVVFVLWLIWILNPVQGRLKLALDKNHWTFVKNPPILMPVGISSPFWPSFLTINVTLGKPALTPDRSFS